MRGLKMGRILFLKVRRMFRENHLFPILTALKVCRACFGTNGHAGTITGRGIQCITFLTNQCVTFAETYKLVDTCDPTIASWSDDGETFIIKDPDAFATQIIPQYFDHNKFSSFARQLNFYGFRKMQSTPIRNCDLEPGTARYVIFYNENFKRGRTDLLENIQRSTKGLGRLESQEQSREIQQLREQVASLQRKMVDLNAQKEDRIRRLELDMVRRMEQMMMVMQEQQRDHLKLQSVTPMRSIRSNDSSVEQAMSASSQQQFPFPVPAFQQQAWEPIALSYPIRDGEFGKRTP